MKQRVFGFRDNEDVPLGAEYLTTVIIDEKVGDNTIRSGLHYFLCAVDKDGKPVDVKFEKEKEDFLS